MRNNGPVTNQERVFDESKPLVSRTDLKGVITDANDAFVEISGFSKQELIGIGHNMVRHPDMPAWAFADLWATVKSGRVWRGTVKNRAKNGDHYWVSAIVSPITRSGRTEGYLSFRKKSSAQEVREAQSLYAQYPGTKGPKKKLSLSSWFSNLGLKNKIQVIVQPITFLVLTGVTILVYNKIHESVLVDAIDKSGSVAMQVIDGANMLMVTGSISDVENRKLLIRKIIEGQHLSSLRLVRTEQVVKQYGAGLPEERLDDPLVSQVIDASVKAGKVIPYTGIEWKEGHPFIRTITPYIESHSFHGTDCLLCHQVEVGSSNGASDMTFDLSAQFDRLRTIVIFLVCGQLAAEILIFFATGWVVRRFVIKPLGEVSQHLDEIVEGDFSRFVNIEGQDEVGFLLRKTQSAKVLMAATIDRIVSLSAIVDDSTNNMRNAAKSSLTTCLLQSESSRSAAATVGDISASIRHTSSSATEIDKAAALSMAEANSGAKTVNLVMSDIAEIGAEVIGASESIGRLGNSAEEINAIVLLIKGIADQTNLLALNAAIEAARAGEAGRGFAVVADEVRKLAYESANSASRIGEVAKRIQLVTKDAQHVILAAVAKVEHGAGLVKEAEHTMDKISTGSESVGEGIAHIVSAIHTQTKALSEVLSRIEQLAQSASDSSRNAQHVDEMAVTLAGITRELKNLTESFKF